jgi:hypothetical protein
MPEVQVKQDNPQQGDSPMTMENVNLQELQRLNEAITVTFDAIRRVAPQLQALQQMAQLQVPWQQPFGIGMQQPYAVGMQHPLLQHLVQHLVQQLSQQNPWTQYQQPIHWGMGQQYQPFGQSPFGISQQPFSFGQQYGQVPFGIGQQPFGIGQQYGQRIF